MIKRNKVPSGYHRYILYMELKLAVILLVIVCAMVYFYVANQSATTADTSYIDQVNSQLNTRLKLLTMISIQSIQKYIVYTLEDLKCRIAK